MFIQPQEQVKQIGASFASAEAFVAVAVPAVLRLEGERRRGKRRLADLESVLAMIWMVANSGMQWRSLALLRSIKWNTVFYHFLRWSRLGLWRRLALGLIAEWRQRIGVGHEPTVGVVDSRSTRSGPTSGVRGVDGGKKINGVKLHIWVDKFGLPMDMLVTAANGGDRDGLRALVENSAAEFPTVKTILADLGYEGEEITADMTRAGFELKATRCGDGKTKRFMPNEIRWVVERTYGWLAQWRRLAVCRERDVRHYADFAWLAIASIVAARLSRVGTGYVNNIA